MNLQRLKLEALNEDLESKRTRLFYFYVKLLKTAAYNTPHACDVRVPPELIDSLEKYVDLWDSSDIRIYCCPVAKDTLVVSISPSSIIEHEIGG